MPYYLNNFSPITYEAFNRSDRTISGFRKSQKKSANKINPGDLFICYMVQMSRWIGIFEVLDNFFISDDPIFYEENDPFVVRFKVNPLVWLPKEQTIPIHDPHIWSNLNFTRDHDPRSSTWTGPLRGSLRLIDDNDAQFLDNMLRSQAENPTEYPFDDAKYQRLLSQRIRRQDGTVSVTVPEEEVQEIEVEEITIRQSHRMQASLTRIGESMGFKIWIPRNDRNAVTQDWQPLEGVLLNELPLNYNDLTIRTIEQIDVIWLRRMSIIRAFEVEHTTAVYSGILRMADLLALQPNMDIKLHIVAPEDRRERVFQEIQRPVFSLLERAPLAECCTFIPYDNLNQLAREKHLSHLSDSVLDEYAEEAE